MEKLTYFGNHLQYIHIYEIIMWCTLNLNDAIYQFYHSKARK